MIHVVNNCDKQHQMDWHSKNLKQQLTMTQLRVRKIREKREFFSSRITSRNFFCIIYLSQAKKVMTCFFAQVAFNIFCLFGFDWQSLQRKYFSEHAKYSWICDIINIFSICYFMVWKSFISTVLDKSI